MKKVFACLSAFVLMLVAFGLALNPAVVNAAEVADGKFIVDPTLEEGDIPIYVMNSIFTTFPSLYDNEALKDPNYNIGRDYYWNEIKLVIPQFDAQGPTGQRYTVYSQGTYSEDVKSAAGTKVYLWCLDEDGNVVTATQTRGGDYDWTSTYGPLFGDVSLSGIRYNVTGQDVVLNDLYREYGIINASNDTDPQYMVINGEGKVVRGVLKESVVAQENVEAFGYSVLFGYKDGQIVVREDVIGGADVNGLSAPDAELDIAQILVDDLNDPILDPVTGEQQTDADGNPLYNQISVDDPEGKPNLFYGKRYVWQWYSEEEFADVKVNTVAYKEEGWLADRWDYAVADPNGGYICFAFLSSLGSYVQITAEESAIHNASVDALVAAGLDAPAKIEETITETEEGTEVVEYAKYRRPIAEKVVIPADGIMYRVGYLDYSGTATTPMFNEVIAHAFEDAMLYGRAPEYQAYARTYNLTATGLVEKNAVIDGESFIVRNENGKFVIEIKAGARLDISELIEITGCLGGFSIAGVPAAEAGANVAAAVSYKNADVSELSYILDVDGNALMWEKVYKYEGFAEAAAAVKAHVLEAAGVTSFSKWNHSLDWNAIFAGEEWDWVLDYMAAVNKNEYEGVTNASVFEAAKADDFAATETQGYFLATELAAFVNHASDSVYSGSLKSADYASAAVQEAIWDFMPEPEPYKYESFEEFKKDLMLDYVTYYASPVGEDGARIPNEHTGTDTRMYIDADGNPYSTQYEAVITEANWSAALEFTCGTGTWAADQFFTSEEYGAKWGWFYTFYGELIANTTKADGSAWGYDVTNKFAWRQSLAGYFGGYQWGSWPASPNWADRSETPYFIGFNKVMPTWDEVEFVAEGYELHDRFTLSLQVTNGATGFVDAMQIDFVVVEDFTPLFRINEEALVVGLGQTSINLADAVKAYDGYYDARNEYVYGHDISRHIDWDFPEGFDPNNLQAGSYTVSARIDSQVSGSSKFAETSFVINVLDQTAPTFVLRNGGVIYVNNLDLITEEQVFAYAYDNVDGNYLAGGVQHNWWTIADDSFEPGMALPGDVIASKITVTDANGNSTSANITIIVTGVEVEIPEIVIPDGGDNGGDEPQPTAPTNCIAMGYVSSFVAAAGLALLVFKKRH